MENTDKVEIGRRLKEFCDNNFKNTRLFSAAIDMKTRNQIYDYFNGKFLLGAKYLSKLAELGCDINWLLLGEKSVVKEKEVEYFGMTLVKQIKLLEKTNEGLETELKKLVYQIIQLKKDCGHKEGCLIKNMKIGNETDS